MPFTPVEGAELFYEVTGDGPDAIVFVHGAGGNHLIWYQQVAYFSRRYRCITYDQRSYGLSKDQSGEAWLALSRDLLGLLDSLEIPRAFLVAQSLGGFACFRLAAEHPDRVQKLVMAGTALGVTDQLAAEMSANQQARREQGRAIFSSGFMAANSPSLTLYRQIAGLNPPFDDRTAQQPPAMDQSALSVFRVPVLFIAGDEDPLSSLSMMVRAADAVPGARLEIMRGAGHPTYWERPDAFNHLVESFFGPATSGR